MALDSAQAITIGGIDVWELDGSGRLSYRDGKATGTRLFLCAWGDRADLMTAIVGTFTRLTDGTLKYTRDPETFPGWVGLQAKDVDIDGVGAPDRDADDSPLYVYAKLTVTYRAEEPNDSGGGGDPEENQVLNTEHLSFRSEKMSIPSGSILWTEGTDSGKPVLDKSFIPWTLIEHTLVKKDLTALPSYTIGICLNCVNDREFMGVAAGKLLFGGAESDKKVDADGNVTYDITYKFLENSEDWNSAWNPTDKAWQKHDEVFAIADLQVVLTGST